MDLHDYSVPSPTTSPDIRIDGLRAVLKSPLPIPEILDSLPESAFDSAKAASLVFGPKLYPMYKRWQATISNPEVIPRYDSVEEWRVVRDALFEIEVGCLPTPYLFLVFMDIEKQEIYLPEPTGAKGNRLPGEQMPLHPCLVVASICGHLMHIGNPIKKVEVCPECLMKHCVEFLQRIDEAWKRACSFDKHDDKDTPVYEDPFGLSDQIRRLWYVEKTDWSNLVAEFEDFSLREQHLEDRAAYEYTQKLSKVLAVTNVAKTCTNALLMAAKCPNLVAGWDTEIIKKKKAMDYTREVWGLKQVGIAVIKASSPRRLLLSGLMSKSKRSESPSQEQIEEWERIYGERYPPEYRSVPTMVLEMLNAYVQYWLTARSKFRPSLRKRRVSLSNVILRGPQRILCRPNPR